MQSTVEENEKICHSFRKNDIHSEIYVTCSEIYVTCSEKYFYPDTKHG